MIVFWRSPRNQQGRGFADWFMALGSADVIVECDITGWAAFGQSPIWLKFSVRATQVLALTLYLDNSRCFLRWSSGRHSSKKAWRDV